MAEPSLRRRQSLSCSNIHGNFMELDSLSQDMVAESLDSMFSVEFAPRLYNEKFQGRSQLLSDFDRLQLKKSSFDSVVVKKWVELWRWKSKVIEKK
jgi:hypothetical protein